MQFRTFLWDEAQLNMRQMHLFWGTLFFNMGLLTTRVTSCLRPWIGKIEETSWWGGLFFLSWGLSHSWNFSLHPFFVFFLLTFYDIFFSQMFHKMSSNVCLVTSFYRSQAQVGTEVTIWRIDFNPFAAVDDHTSPLQYFFCM